MKRNALLAIVLALLTTLLSNGVPTTPVPAATAPATTTWTEEPVLRPADGPRHVAISLNPAIEVVGSPEQRTIVDERARQFAIYGMQLPDLRVRFHDDEYGCDNHLGLFDFTQDPWTIEICSDMPWVVPHELGHAWERANLNLDRREAYMAHRGLTVWQDSDLSPAEQGIEDIAFTIQKAIQQGPTVNSDVESAFAALMDLARQTR